MQYNSNINVSSCGAGVSGRLGNLKVWIAASRAARVGLAKDIEFNSAK